MSLIQPFDGSILIKSYRAGREDRAADDKVRAEQAAQERRRGLLEQLMPGQTGGGVAGQYAPSRPAKQPTMDDAFNPEAMGQIGAMDAGGAAPGPVVTPQAPAAPQMAPQPQQRPNPMAMARLIIEDPEVGGQIASAFKTMDDAAIKMAQSKNDIMGSAAKFIAMGKTPEERIQRFQSAAPQLLAMGWSPQELDGVDNDLSDTALQGYQALAIAYDNAIDNALAEREFMMGKTVAIPAEGSLATVKPVIGADGSVGTKLEYAIGGPGEPAAGSIPPEAINALKKGEGTPEQFDAIFGAGAAARIMGGGGGDATGGFPG